MNQPRAEEKLTRQIVVRVPTGLYEAIKKDAHDNGRTPAQSVRFHLRRALLHG